MFFLSIWFVAMLLVIYWTHLAFLLEFSDLIEKFSSWFDGYFTVVIDHIEKHQAATFDHRIQKNVIQSTIARFNFKRTSLMEWNEPIYTIIYHQEIFDPAQTDDWNCTDFAHDQNKTTFLSNVSSIHGGLSYTHTHIHRNVMVEHVYVCKGTHFLHNQHAAYILIAFIYAGGARMCVSVCSLDACVFDWYLDGFRLVHSHCTLPYYGMMPLRIEL